MQKFKKIIKLPKKKKKMKLQKLNLSLLIYFGINTQKTHIMEQNHQLWLKQIICHPVQKFIFSFEKTN